MSDIFVVKLTSFASRLGGYLQRLPQEKCRTVLMIAIIFIIITLLGNNFWFFMPAQDNAALLAGATGMNTANTATADKKTISYDEVSGWRLFGDEPSLTTDEADATRPATDIIEENVGATKLNIRLVGIIHASDPRDGYAIIQYSGESSLFKVGQAIPVGNDITLAKVLVDKVIINNKGEFESLELFDSNKKSPIRTNARKVSSKGRVLDKRNDRKVTQLMRDYRKQLLNDPMSMANVIRVSLATDASGNVIGYRVRPGRHRKQFAELGLKSGDIITAINGMSLSNQENAMQIYSNLSSLTEANFDIKRGNSDISIMVNLN